MTLRSSEGNKPKMDDKKQEDHTCSGKKITRAAMAYGDGFSASARTQKKDSDARIFPVNGVRSNADLEMITNQTTKHIQEKTATEQSKIISSEQKKINGMNLRSSNGKKRKRDDDKPEDHSCSSKKFNKAAILYGHGISSFTSTWTKKTDGDAQIFAVNGVRFDVLHDVEDTTRLKPLKTGNQPADDADPWIQSIITNNRKNASNALKHGLPNKSQLDHLVKHFGRKSKLILEICDKICCSVQQRDKMIASVWAAYSADKIAEGQISFVVVVKEDIKLDKMDYRFVIRKQGQVNNEGKEVLSSKKFDKYLSKMSINEVQSIRESINKNNVKLMQKHKYLTVISASPVRSKGYGGNHIIECEACIVFYVLVKGYIPISEEPFALTYNGVAVDVREGFFVNYGANDFQATLKHGCQIERQMQGTLGGFITHREFGTCGLTSGHVLLTPDEFKKFKPGNTMQDWNIRHSDNMVYQPSQVGSGINDHFCGMLVRAVYLEGGGGESGIDVAIFQVEKRFPDGGDFPVFKRGKSSGMRYDSGKTAGATRLGFGGVTKFGAGTGERKGTVLFNAPVMSVKHYTENIFKVDGKYDLRLHNLLEVNTCTVSSKNEPLPFAGPRDSGALVFCEGEAKDLYCVGMIEGGITAGTCAVMPIAPILQHLQIPAMKSFERNKLEQKVDKGFEDMRSSFNKVMGAIRQKNRTTSSKRKKYAKKK